MGRGGRGGGGGGGGGGGSVIGGINLPRFMRGAATRIFGPSRGMTDALNQVAIARGLRDADELVGRLVGKQLHEVSFKEALDLLQKECSREEYEDFGWTYYFGPGKGYRPCNDHLKRYLKCVKESEGLCEYFCKHLKKYCGYTDDELNSLM